MTMGEMVGLLSNRDHGTLVKVTKLTNFVNWGDPNPPNNSWITGYCSNSWRISAFFKQMITEPGLGPRAFRNKVGKSSACLIGFVTGAFIASIKTSYTSLGSDPSNRPSASAIVILLWKIYIRLCLKHKTYISLSNF